MKASTALFASVVAICCTINLVTGQIHFADGTSQSTAYTGQAGENGYYIPGDAYFSFIIPKNVEGLGVSGQGRIQASDTVPSGQELVILQVKNSHINDDNFLSSRLPYPDDDTPSLIAYCPAAVYEANGLSVTHNYLDGSVIVDENHQLWLEYDSYYYESNVNCFVNTEI